MLNAIVSGAWPAIGGLMTGAQGSKGKPMGHAAANSQTQL